MRWEVEVIYKTVSQNDVQRQRRKSY